MDLLNREPRRTYWNLKKVNWAIFKNLTNEVLTDSLVMPNFEYSSRLFTLAVLKCASLCVPRGQQNKFTPFWNENLRKREIRQESSLATLGLVKTA
ncbi:hypothetical protein TNCT_660681 [Trichonephila clavata]|uniref:Uncharacterized protein n=1 Tax=Trichonephila clavata TaxID=2740835 RepID=A0A8X6KE67_TRICU|nr:hypothetical protein TNCT_660681 [Trichonephila clavata]